MTTKNQLNLDKLQDKLNQITREYNHLDVSFFFVCLFVFWINLDYSALTSQVLLTFMAIALKNFLLSYSFWSGSFGHQFLSNKIIILMRVFEHMFLFSNVINFSFVFFNFSNPSTRFHTFSLFLTWFCFFHCCFF